MKISLIVPFLAFTLLYSCNDSRNEANSDTNTHNTSQPNASAHSEEIRIDERSTIPSNRLNDGNLETRMSSRSTLSEELATPADRNTQEQQVDLQDDPQRDISPEGGENQLEQGEVENDN